MMFSKKGYTVKVDGEAIHVYRDVFSWTPDDGETTKLRVSAYFGGQEKTPQKMFLNASNIVLDDLDYAISDNERCATNHYFMNSIFNFGETLVYYATEDIFVPVAMEAQLSERLKDSRNETSVSPFFEVRSGSAVHLWAGGDVIWSSGFSCLGGAEMTCISNVPAAAACVRCNPSATCKTTEALTQEEKDEILASFGVSDTMANEELPNEYIEPDYEEETETALPYFEV